MSLGQLNEFGQYTSELDLEPVPDLDKHKGTLNLSTAWSLTCNLACDLQSV